MAGSHSKSAKQEGSKILPSPADDFINELIRKRKLQQEALQKIITSIDSKKEKLPKATRAPKTPKTQPDKNQSSH